MEQLGQSWQEAAASAASEQALAAAVFATVATLLLSIVAPAIMTLLGMPNVPNLSLSLPSSLGRILPNGRRSRNRRAFEALFEALHNQRWSQALEILEGSGGSSPKFARRMAKRRGANGLTALHMVCWIGPPERRRQQPEQQTIVDNNDDDIDDGNDEPSQEIIHDQQNSVDTADTDTIEGSVSTEEKQTQQYHKLLSLLVSLHPAAGSAVHQPLVLDPPPHGLLLGPHGRLHRPDRPVRPSRRVRRSRPAAPRPAA